MAESGLAWTVVRPAAVFGPGDRLSCGLARIVERFPLVPVPGDGSARFQPVAAEDAVAVLASLLRCEAAVGRNIELGGPETLTLDELIRRIAGALGRRRALVHLPPGLVRVALRLPGRRRGARITDEELTMLLVGSTAGSPPPELGLPRPSRRFLDLPWLRPVPASPR